MEEKQQIRLNKYLAACGVCSRREADRMIEDGLVTVNGKVADMGMKVSSSDAIKVGRKLLQGPAKKVVLAFYKPVGIVCTEKDPHAEKKVNDIVRYKERVTYIGRLDKDSEGLLLLTNDGELINAMMLPSQKHEREYTVKVSKEITQDFIDKMSKGVYLKELNVKTKKCEVVKTGKFTFNIILTQGLNRQIRRMCEACGMKVMSLKRIRVMDITLDKLNSGEYRVLSDKEMEKLYIGVGLIPPKNREEFE